MIKTILHLSDIHIRKLHRFVEYRAVFNRLYKQAKQLKPSLIYVGGDVVHGKLDTSPEEVRLVADFFLSLCKIAPTIVIPGNHDCNLNNKSREDALSPIIDLVKKINPNMHYWKKSGSYTIDNVDFGVMSIYDIDKEGKQLTNNLPDPNNLDNDHKIALFHGGVGSYTYDNGLQVNEDEVTLQTFDGYDITMLGDIHKHQSLNSKETIKYCGSLIQQSFQEQPAHGFLLWDVETKKSEFHKVENDYGYKLIEVIDGVIQNKMNYIPPKGNIKIKYWDTSLDQIKDIQMDIRKKYPKLKDVVTERQDNISIGGDRENQLNIGDVRDITYQNELIKDFLERNVVGIDEKTIKRVHQINEMTNNSPEIYDGDITRNVDWKIKSFEFDNMFCYGKGNKIDFEKLNGTVGVVAPNHSGKSALMDAISYTIYDVCSRTGKALDVMNKKKTTFKAKLNLEINGMDYWVERDAEYKVRNHKDGTKTDMCPVKVRFYMIDDSGEEVDLSGAARFNSQYGSGTNEEIRKVLGTFDDFILTSLSLQTNGMNFIDKKQAERKKVLSTFMDIDIFEQLYDVAKSDSNEERITLKRFQRKDSYKELASIENQIIELDKEEIELSKQDKDFIKQITELENKKIELTRELYKIDESYDIDKLHDTIDKFLTEQQQLEKQLKEDKEYKETLRPLFNRYHIKLAEIDEEGIQNDYERYKELKTTLRDSESNIKLLESKIKSLQNHLDELDKYEYDENCEYCLNNGKEQIHEQEHLQTKIKELEAEHQRYMGMYMVHKHNFEKVEDAEEMKEDFDRFQYELNMVQHDAVKIGGKIDKNNARLEHLETEIDNTEHNIELYYKSEEKIESNYKLNKKIIEISDKLHLLNLDNLELDEKYKQVISKLSVA
ncbi:MAG: AAA family ATPase, partial [Candidatus Pelagibacter sp.]|nr:AAA family ATPase [Candidatus Pelagibacter sp.]